MEKIFEASEKNRWEIKKIGLLNYWWYDEEEFEFASGRLILRGTNGSGKSVTMQSFIPLLLDGNKSPERLDPFNTKARKIEDYILGYGEQIKEENTSYLYMELLKKETRNYITIGMGLNAKKNSGVKFWGFIIKDGRRVGKDIFLYKDPTNKIPLSKQELKNRIGEGGQVVDNQKEYAMLVNENIFGFETLSEYQEFIKLLIEIRTPKLSKDGFKPSIITEIMSNSLRGLSDEDLKAVSESIENMNKTKEQLEMLNESKKALKQIITPYDNYNKHVLFDKAKKYNEKNTLYKRVLREATELEKKIKDTQKAHEENEERKQEIEKEIEVYEYKKRELSSNELWKQKQEQADLQKQLDEINDEITKKEKMEDDKKRVIIQKEEGEKQTQENYETEKDNFKHVENNMEEIAKQIDYDEFFFKKDEIKIEEKYDYKYFKEDIKRFCQKIEKGKKALEKEKIVNNEYEESLKNLDKEKNEKAKQDSLTDKSRQELEEAKDNFTEEMYKWENSNEILKLENEQMGQIIQKVQNYGENVEFDDVILSLYKPYSKINQKITDEKAILNSKIKQLEEEEQELKHELDDWKNKREPEPVRTEKVKQNREKLKQKNIPYIELYKCIDFKKEIKEDQKNRIESALLDMGILDALIIPKEFREEIKKQDPDFVDKYLYENPVEFKHDLTHIFDVKLPQDVQIKQETVISVLKSVMLEDKQASTYINEKGEYKIGILEGLSDKEEKAKFIGTETRRQFKEKKIQEIEEQINSLINSKKEIEGDLEKLQQQLETLQEEYNNFPKKDSLEEKYKALKVNITKTVAIKENIIRLENILSEKLEILKQAKEETLNLTKGLRFKLDVEIYQENLDKANDLKEYVFEMEKYHNNMINEQNRLAALQETIETLKYDLDNILYEKGKLIIKQKTLKGKIEAIKQMSEGVEELEKQMEELLDKLDKLPKEKEKLIENGGKQVSLLEQLKKEELTKAEKVNSLEKQQNIARDIFEQELSLKYVIGNYENIQDVAHKVISDYQYFDRESKDINSYYGVLIEKYKDNYEKLLDYNLAIGQIFIKEIENEEDNEITEVEKTRTRSDISCFVNGKKVDLKSLQQYIDETIEETQNLVADEDRNLFEEILIGAVGRKIRERIYFAKSWIESMNKLMKSLNTSSGLSFSLNWKPKPATCDEEIDTREIVEILNSDPGLLKPEDITRVATHFRTKFKIAEQEFKEKGAVVSFYNIIKETLDYRKWFEFQFMYKKVGEQSKELTNNAFFKLSGGEKAMAMYIPLFAAVCARYQSARKDCLRIISLDEAFAGVDDNNIKDMFRILTNLELEYIINSQVLWGEYETVPDLAICELISDVNTKVVSVIRYHWNGTKRELVSNKSVGEISNY